MCSVSNTVLVYLEQQLSSMKSNCVQFLYVAYIKLKPKLAPNATILMRAGSFLGLLDPCFSVVK